MGEQKTGQKIEYECKACGGRVTLKEKPEKAPECCGKPMTPVAKPRGCGCGCRGR